MIFPNKSSAPYNAATLLLWMVLMSIMTTTISHAADTATANADDMSDIVAIQQMGKQNTAIAEALNEPLADAFSDDAVDSQDEASQNSSSEASLTPRRSTVTNFDPNQIRPDGYVMDRAEILTPSQEQQLTSRINTLYQQGYGQIAILTVPTTNGTDIASYAIDKAHELGVGGEHLDDGIFIVVAVNDRKVWIATGYGREGVLPDAVVNRIIREDVTPLFKRNQYAGGLMAALDRIETRLTTDPDTLAEADAQAMLVEKNQADNPSPIGLFIIFMVMGTFVTTVLGRFLGSLVVSGGFFVISLSVGGGFFMTLILTIFLWMFLISRGGGGGSGGKGGSGRGGRRRRRGGGVVFLPGGFGGGGFGGGLGGGGGFGGGGFGGFGGGGFGGGGAGGSW